jgi:hypothetical protein
VAQGSNHFATASAIFWASFCPASWLNSLWRRMLAGHVGPRRNMANLGIGRPEITALWND